MERKGISLTRNLETENENYNVERDIGKCIICMKDNEFPKTSTESGRKRVLEAAEIRQDEVTKRLQQIAGKPFVYHVSNDCYKKYTHKVLLEVISKDRKEILMETETAEDVASSSAVSCARHITRSSVTSVREEPSQKTHPRDLLCIICNSKKHVGITDKYRISESNSALKFLKMTSFFHDEVFTRVADLEDERSIFAADIYFHKTCMRAYERKYDRNLEKQLASEESPEQDEEDDALSSILQQVEPLLERGEGFILSDIRDRANLILDSQQVDNRKVKKYLVERFGENVTFSTPKEANKCEMVFLSSSASAESIADVLRHKNSIQDCAKLLRKAFQCAEFDLNDRFCDAQDLKEAWNNIDIPDPVLTFFAELFDFKASDFLSLQEESDSDEENEIHDIRVSRKSLSKSKRLKIVALYQIISYILNNGSKKTPLHVLNGEAVYSTCKSKALIQSLNRLGLSVSYQEVLRHHNDLANYIADSSQGAVPLPSTFDPAEFTVGAFDNFDHEEATVSGIGGTHDTVSILVQDKPVEIRRKPLRSETSVVQHGSLTFNHNLPCQQVKEFLKPAKKPILSEDYSVPASLYTIDEATYSKIKNTEFSWTVGKLDLSQTSSGVVNSKAEKQEMPSWSAFNSVIRKDDLPERIIGFIPIIPQPVTEFSTVYTALKNFQDVRTQLQQSVLPVACDEGVYRIAREIQMLKPDEFNDIVLIMGTFHMTKVVLGCIGKYLKGSGAENVFIETESFGVTVTESVLSGANYVRSIKGMFQLAEALSRLQLTEFFKEAEVTKYSEELKAIENLKKSLSPKNFDESRKLLEIASNNIDGGSLFTDVNAFVARSRQSSETFSYWDNVITLVSLLKDLIRADREGHWKLHLATVQKLQPLFAVFDCTNYRRYSSLYLEDMRRVEHVHPELYQKFLEGKFVVKTSNSSFSAVALDMSLEQSINRTKKGASGIVGNTKRKDFVTRWDIIFHELHGIHNLHKELTGVKGINDELRVHHEYTSSQTDFTERRVQEIMAFIDKNENPFRLDISSSYDLHNIVTKQVVPDKIKTKLLAFLTIGNEIYEQYRKERFVDKTTKVFHIIHRTNLPTFLSIETDSKQLAKKEKKRPLKISTEGQKIIDLARVRDYDMEKLLTFDLVSSSYLFQDDGFMTKTNKSALTAELEKHLDADSLTDPKDWPDERTCYIVDVMAYIRKLRVSLLRTFGDMANELLNYVLKVSLDAERIDLVFDSYVDNSPKSTERARRSSHSAIALHVIEDGTPIPVQMETFWASSSNKAKLQSFLKNAILRQVAITCPDVQFVLSATIDQEEHHQCTSTLHGIREQRDELLFPMLEEADHRIMPHALHATKEKFQRVVILSPDTDVLVLALYHWNTFCTSGLLELWIRAGVSETTRYLPVHILSQKLGRPLCAVLPAMHSLTGADCTSKFGTKAAGMRCDPASYLREFGTHLEFDDLEHALKKAESFLVQVLKKGSSCKTFDELRYWIFHHSKSVPLQDLPPTSRSGKGHILRSWLCTYIQVMCIENFTLPDVKCFGYEEHEDGLVPSALLKLLPDDLVPSCNCIKCATKNCECRKAGIPCCVYCKCTSVPKQECKNPLKQ